MKKKYSVLPVIVLLFIASINSFGQKVLSKQETQWVNEAREQLAQALSNPDMDDDTRKEVIKRSATTLKEYGQPWDYPNGKIPLQDWMDDNFDQCKESVAEMNKLKLQLGNQSMEGKLKLINAMQIEMVEDQVELLIPGKAPVSLSIDAVRTVLDWNIVEGVNGGKSQDAEQLKNMFLKLVEQRKLIDGLDEMSALQMESLRKINEDRKKLMVIEPQWRKIFRDATNSTFTIKGYEGAKLASASSSTNNANTTSTSNSSVSSSPSSSDSGFKRNVLVGTWKFGFEQTGYFYWTFNNDGTWKFVDKMNEGEQTLTGKYVVAGNTLKLYGPKSECVDVEGIYPYVISDGDLEFKGVKDQCISRKLTLTHIWSK